MKDSKAPSTIKSIAFVMKFLLKISPLYVVFSIILYILKGMLQSFANVWLLMKVIDAVTYGENFGDLFIPLIKFTLFALFVGILNAFFIDWFEKKSKQHFSNSMRKRLFEKAIQCDIKYYDDPKFYDNYVWTAKEIDNRAFCVFQNLVMLIQRIATISSIIVMLAGIDIQLILLIIVCSVLSFFITNKQNVFQYNCDKNVNKVTQKKRYVERIFFVQDNLKEIHSSNLPSLLLSMYNQSGKEQRDLVKDSSKRIWKMDFLRFLLGENVLIFCAGILVLTSKVMKNDMSVGAFVSGITGLQVIFSSFSFVLGKLSYFKESALYIEKFMAFWNIGSDFGGNQKQIRLDKYDNFTVRNVGFSYDDRKKVLDNVVFDAKRGEKIAIVGANGSGKTTLIKLLFRLYDVLEGQISINDENIKNYELDSIRRQYSCLFQDMNLYACSFKENIAMNVVEAEDEEHITEVAKKADVYELVNSYEKGLDTNITREFDDKGVLLSGGQKSKLGIARAIYKKAACIVLDEPTATMDPFAEEEFNRRVAEFSEDKILIIVSHRLTTTVFADKILVIVDGTIVEKGSHKDLMNKGGVYYKMFQMQAEQYVEEK